MKKSKFNIKLLALLLLIVGIVLVIAGFFTFCT